VSKKKREKISSGRLTNQKRRFTNRMESKRSPDKGGGVKRCPWSSKDAGERLGCGTLGDQIEKKNREITGKLGGKEQEERAGYTAGGGAKPPARSARLPIVKSQEK